MSEIVVLAVAAAAMLWPGDDRSNTSNPSRVQSNSPGQWLPEDLVLTVLGSCLRAGLAVAIAADAAARAAGGPVGAGLRAAAMELRLGVEPRQAWSGHIARLAPDLSRAVVRAIGAGTPIADSLDALAARVRQRDSARRQAKARRAAVAISAPLAVCFLPAFVCLGIAPMVIGLVSEVFAHGN